MHTVFLYNYLLRLFCINDNPDYLVSMTTLFCIIACLCIIVCSDYFMSFSLSGTSSMTAQDAEAQLKALLFGRKGSTPSSSGTGSPAVASPLRKQPYTPKWADSLCNKVLRHFHINMIVYVDNFCVFLSRP